MEQILVKITKGTYGHIVGNTVARKTANDAPFFLDEDKAERLFGLGVAEPVCDDKYPGAYVYGCDEIPDGVTIENDGDEGTGEGDETEFDEAKVEVQEVNLEEMTLDELKKFAEPFGVKFKVGTKKADFIKSIKQALVAYDEVESDGAERPPSFDAAEAVQ